MKESTSARWWDLPAALMLFAALAIAARRLFITEWTDHLTLVGILTFLGALTGLALGQSRFSSRQASAIALIYGLFTVFWQLGLTLEDSMPWIERLTILLNRMFTSFDQLARREAVPDPMFFLSLVACLSWTLSIHAGYTLTRHGRVWRAIIPTGVAMLVVQTYDPFLPARIWLLALYIFVSLLLLARLAYLRRHAHWQEARASLPPYLGLDLIRVVLLPTALLILLSWTMPALASVLPSAERAWDVVTHPWESVLDFLSNAVVSLGGESGGQGGSYYDENLSLGRGSILSDTPVMLVQVPAGLRASTRNYWRARIYDSYVGGQWTSTFSDAQSVNSNYSDLTFSEIAGRLEATFTFTPATGIATFYTPSQPVWISRSARADLAYNPDGTADISALHATPHLRAGQAYQVRSSVSIATAAQLRAAGTDYPEWVTRRYLQLPSITLRTRELAGQIAAGLDNPYDIAVAVTDYLRTQIPYAETTPSPDPNQEPLDWFLFDLRRGFCNYYASAEVVLLRSLGIPARLAVGFAQGTRQSPGNIYQVRQLDAHAWPEVYFPNLGWIEFEPTASQPPLSRPSGEGQDAGAGSTTPGEAGTGEGRSLEDRLEELLAADEDLFLGPSTAATSRPRTIVTFWNTFLVLALVTTVLAWRVYRRRGSLPLPVLLEMGLLRLDLKPPAPVRLWALWARLPPLGRAYLELNQVLTWLGVPPHSSDTPAERAAALTRLLPATAAPTQQLLAEYHATIYSLRPGSAQVARTASHAIRRLSWRAGVRMRVDRALRPFLTLARRLVSPFQ